MLGLVGFMSGVHIIESSKPGCVLGEKGAIINYIGITGVNQDCLGPLAHMVTLNLALSSCYLLKFLTVGLTDRVKMQRIQKN